MKKKLDENDLDELKNAKNIGEKLLSDKLNINQLIQNDKKYKTSDETYKYVLTILGKNQNQISAQPYTSQQPITPEITI